MSAAARATAALGATLVGLAVLFCLTGIPAWIPAAPLTIAGIASPLSGMTRSFVAMASGDVGAAFAWHPLGPPCFVACAAAPVLVVARVRLPRPLATRAFATGLAAVFAAAWVRQIAVLG